MNLRVQDNVLDEAGFAPVLRGILDKVGANDLGALFELGGGIDAKVDALDRMVGECRLATEHLEHLLLGDDARVQQRHDGYLVLGQQLVARLACQELLWISVDRACRQVLRQEQPQRASVATYLSCGRRRRRR